MQEQAKFEWREIVQLGLLAGLAALFVCLVGMVDTFGEKDVIGGIVTQGYILLVLIWVGFGYMINRRQEGGSSLEIIVGGAVVGGISSVVLVILVLIAEPINLRSVLVNASPALIEDLTFNLDRVLGSVLLLVAGIVFGALGAGIPALSEKVRKPLLMGLVWVLAIGVFQDVLAPIIPRAISSFMFDVSGLSALGAALVFVIVAGFTILWAQQGGGVRSRVEVLSSERQKTMRWVLLGLGVFLVAILPQILGSFLSDVLSTVGLYILMGLGLNIVVGYAGLLDLGYVAFFAIGAYIAAVLTSTGC